MAFFNEELYEDLSEEEVLQDDQENQDEYCEGGYHPVKIGDCFRDRYHVVRKLGWGHSATVWRCWDNQCKQYVALKIMKSESQFTRQALHEIKVLKTIDYVNENDPNRDRIIKLLDNFSIYGENGFHECLVFEVESQDLCQFISSFENFKMPLPTAKSIIKQILQGLDYLHTKCGLIHTDIKADNIFISVDKNRVFKLDKSDMKEEIVHTMDTFLSESYFNSTKTQCKSDENGDLNLKIDRVNSCADLPTVGDGYQSLGSGASCPNLKLPEEKAKVDAEISIKIGDLGNCLWQMHRIDGEIQSREYRAPEVILRAGFGPAADIWSTACLLFILVTGCMLIDIQSDNDYHHLSLILELLGDTPDNIDYIRKYSDDSFTDLKPKQLVELLSADDCELDENEVGQIAEILQYMLVLDPKNRPTARDCVNHSWLQF